MGVGGVHRVGVLELPLPPGPLDPLPAAVPLHVRAARIVDKGELQQCTEHKSLEMQIFSQRFNTLKWQTSKEL